MMRITTTTIILILIIISNDSSSSSGDVAIARTFTFTLNIHGDLLPISRIIDLPFLLL